jgi:uncharacterized protein YgiM (DUF1202 family)
MKTWCMVVALAALPAGAVAQEPGKGPEAKASFEKRAFPFEGEVSVERLNVRMFPKSDQQSIITTVLSQGEKVVVVGEKDDFYQILPPKGSTAWVFGRSVKKEGAGAVTTASDVPVRLDSRVNADVVASLKEGEPVKIVAEHMGWYKIEAPAAVKYYIGKKYVKLGEAVAVTVPAPPKGKDEVKPAPAEDGDAKARATLQVADALLDDQTRLVNEKKLEAVDFSRVVAAYESARDQAKSAAVKSEAERGLNRIQQLHLIWEGVRAQIIAQKQKVDAELAKLNEPKPEPPKGPLMTGYVDTTGLLWKRPGTHKLIMGGKIVCFLRSKEGDEKMVSRLNDFYQKYVGINGTLIKNPEGWDGYSVIVVDEIVPIEK